jgi:hypothetical protein
MYSYDKQASIPAKNIAKSYAQGQQLLMPKVFGGCMVLVWHCDNFVARVGKAATYLKAGACASNVYICCPLQGLASSLRNTSILKKPPERSLPVMPCFLQSGSKELCDFWTRHKDKTSSHWSIWIQ